MPLSFPVLTRHSAFDLERIEVLKGPQGTLFGQNSTGGAINYIAAKPTTHFEAGGDLSYGRFNDVLVNAHVSGPLSDRLTARISVQSDHADGWQESNSRPGDRNGGANYAAARLQLDYRPTDRLRFLFNANGWIDRSEPQVPQFLEFNLQAPVATGPLLGSQLSPLTNRAADWTEGYARSNNKMLQLSLRSDFDITDSVALTALSSYTRYDQKQKDDGDGLPIADLDLSIDNGHIKSFAQEIRLSNAGRGRLRWVVGGNYEHSSTDQYVRVQYPDATTNASFAPLGYPFSDNDYYNKQRIRNLAAFANIDADIGRTITLKGGLRYTDSRNRARSCTRIGDLQPGNAGELFYDVILGGAFGTYPEGSCFAINNLGVGNNGVASGAPGEFAGSLNQHNLSWRTGIDWKPSSGLLFYGNIARGYKAGSFPAISGSAFVQYLPVRQETVLSYELGFKTSVFDKLIQIEGAAFYYDYKDKQLRSKIEGLPFGILDVLQNIPKSSVRGGELSVSARPIRGLSVSAQATYLDAKIDSFTGINAGGLQANFDGTRMPYTPRWQLGGNIDYDFTLNGNWRAFAGASVTYRSRTSAIVGGDLIFPANPNNAVFGLPSRPIDKPYVIDAYALVDLRLGVETTDHQWRLTIWGKNIFNKYYWNNVVATFDTISRYTGKPATYGLTVAYNWK